MCSFLPEEFCSRRESGAIAPTVPPIAASRVAALCLCSDSPRLFQLRILENCHQGRVSAVRERVGSRLAIMNYEALDPHCLHRMRGDADGDVADASRGAKQDLLCREFRRRPLCYGYSRRQLFATAAIAASRVAA